MKLNEQYNETWEGYADEPLSIYQIYTSFAKKKSLLIFGCPCKSRPFPPPPEEGEDT